MKLTYRGARYETNSSPLEVRETDILNHHWEAQHRCQTLQENMPTLRYRGTRYTTEQVANALSSATSETPRLLSYRGVKYVRYGDGRTNVAPAQEDVIPNTTAAIFKEVSRVHKANMRLSLERRLKAARQRGDQQLIHLLEAECQQLAL